jgi:DNA repair protein RadC
MERLKDFVGEMEITYKRTQTLTKQVKNSRDAEEFLRPYFDDCMDDHEEFKVLHLNRANHIVNIHEASKGTDAACIVSIKDIMRQAILMKTHAIIVAHNHPSGGLKASDEDIKISKKIREASKLFDINLLDSLILTREGYLSLADNGDI